MGPQMPTIQVAPPQIRVIVVGDGGASVAKGAVGPGDGPIVRMILGMKAEVTSVEHVPTPGLRHRTG